MGEVWLDKCDVLDLGMACLDVREHHQKLFLCNNLPDYS